MTPEQRTKLKLLNGCRFFPASWAKRFVRNLHAEPDDYELTDSQAYQVDRVYYLYRKQIQSQHHVLDCPAFINPPERPSINTDADEATGRVIVYRQHSQSDRQREREQEARERLAKWNAKVGGK